MQINGVLRAFTSAAAALLAFSSLVALAQDYPSRPIRIVVPYPAGGATDQLARIIQAPLQETLGQPVIIENKAGAGGAIGTEAVVNSPSNGYTLVFGNSGPNSMAPAIKKAAYDPIKDLMPISFVATVPLFLEVQVSSPVNSVQEFIDLVKSKPGQFNYGSVGIASASHLIGEYFNYRAGLKMTHVPYKGGAPAIVGFLSGEVQSMFATGLDSLAHVRAGKLKILGITTEKRTDLAPGVPTISETLPGFSSVIWFGLLAPKGTPPEVISKIHDAIAKSVARPNVKKAFADLSTEAVSNTPDEFSKVIADELAQWTKVVRESGAKFE